MFSKIINYTVGIVAVFVIVGALIFVQKNNNSNEVSVANSTNDSALNSTEQTGVLAEVTQLTTFEASIQNETVLANGKTELEIFVAINNISDTTVQFSPPIDISMLSIDDQKTYNVESSPNTTLFGGPLEPGQNMNGVIYFVVDAPLAESNLTINYQPNYSTITQSISL